ncbi:MAG: MipA/OmpV family protein [Litorimonas sp.]
MKTFVLALILSLGSTASVLAQSEVSNESAETNVAFVGALGTYSSEYLGSDQKEFGALPYLSIQDYKGIDLFGTSLSYRAVETGTGQGLGKWSLRAGPNLTYQGGRDSDDSPTLTGLEDIDASVLLGGYMRGTFGPVGFRFDAGQDILGGHDGVVANASIGTFLPLGKIKVQPSASVSWGSADHNQSFFGITQAQSNASGLTVNDLDSGVYGYSVNLVSWYELNDDYVVTFIGSHRWFTGDADDSPIILAEDGSDTGVFFALGIARKFNL